MVGDFFVNLGYDKTSWNNQMRVKTKYGNGSLIGIGDNGDSGFSYEVLLENTFNEDLSPDDVPFNEKLPTKERIYYCRWVEFIDCEKGDKLRLDSSGQITRTQ